MKKLILVLAILLAVPACALNLSLTQQSPDGNYIDLNYAGADSGNLPRAFALNVTVTSPAQIVDISGYKTGESNSTTTLGYGIYPARIDIATNGTVTSWGSPLADLNDPGTTGSGLGTNKVVLEFGSLYVGSGNAPATSGKLCTLKLFCNGATGSITVAAAEEDTYRGGVVLEDGTAPDPNLTASLVLNICGTPPPPLPGQASNPTPANHSNAIAGSTNLSWTAGSDANSHRIYFGPNSLAQMVFVKEQSGTTLDPNTTGDLGQGRKWYWRVDEKNVTGITTGIVWDFNTLDCYKSTDANANTIWAALGRPDCWCYKRHCRGDSDGKSGYGKPITIDDLANFQAGFNKTTTQLKGVVDSKGVPAACGDYNHKASYGKPVTIDDLALFQAYFNKTTTSVPQCPSTHINFWTN